MAHRKTERNPLFAGRWFEDDIILLCLRWYFRFKLSCRDLVEILGERGFAQRRRQRAIAPTILSAPEPSLIIATAMSVIKQTGDPQDGR